MFKKIIILSFIFTFLLATTGMPLSLHLCAMQETATLETCDICTDLPAEPLSCCGEENGNYNTFFTKLNDTCCDVEIVDKKVNDEFFAKSELRKVTFSPVMFLSLPEEDQSLLSFKNHTAESALLPQSSGRIFIDISVLLI